MCSKEAGFSLDGHILPERTDPWQPAPFYLLSHSFFIFARITWPTRWMYCESTRFKKKLITSSRQWMCTLFRKKWNVSLHFQRIMKKLFGTTEWNANIPDNPDTHWFHSKESTNASIPSRLLSYYFLNIYILNLHFIESNSLATKWCTVAEIEIGATTRYVLIDWHTTCLSYNWCHFVLYNHLRMPIIQNFASS